MAIFGRQQQLDTRQLYISCVVPAHNESPLILEFLNALEIELDKITDRFEILVIDDGSQDDTVAKICAIPQPSPVKLLALSRNFGKEVALTAGLEHCQGDVAILIDADFQHPLATIHEFLAQWAQGYEMVYGVRANRLNESRTKKSFANLFYWIMRKITNIDIPSDAGDFRLLDRKVVDSINQLQERSRFMKGLYAWVGFKRIAVPFQVGDRPAGQSSWGFARLTELALTGITSFSDIPLRVWGLIGFLISGVSVVYALYFLVVTLIYGADLPGFPSIIVAVMFLGGVQLLSIGIMGEYIARIFTEVKNRPKYLIEKRHNLED